MTLLNILAGFVGLTIGLLLCLAVILCASKYRWSKLKRRVIEAIEALDLWDVVDNFDPFQSFTTFKSITRYLDAHSQRHCFYERGGAFELMQMLAEIRSKRKQSN